MAKFESSLTGNREIGNQGGLKRFVVSDDEGFAPDNRSSVQPSQDEIKQLELQLAEARRAKQLTANTVSPEAKKRFEILSGIGRATKDIPIEGYSFSIRTIKAKELREIISATMQAQNGADGIFESRAQTLARAIYKIDGHSIDDILDDNSIEAKLEFVQNLDEEIAQYLYGEYDKLTKDHKKKFSSVEEEVKEIGGDLKKSS